MITFIGVNIYVVIYHFMLDLCNSVHYEESYTTLNLECITQDKNQTQRSARNTLS